LDAAKSKLAEMKSRIPLDNQEKKDYLLIIKRSWRMGQKQGEMVQGTLEMLILKTLALEPMHGYGVASVRSEWRSTENNRRAKYYMLTAVGRKALTDETAAWGRQTAAIARILEA
jgi:DNA-binding PadR family transcriptional regulator